MTVYMVRRKSDGKFARNTKSYGVWGVGQTYSQQAFLHAVNLFNGIGKYYEYAHKPENGAWLRSLVTPFNDLQLVEINMDTGEKKIIVDGKEIKDGKALQETLS